MISLNDFCTLIAGKLNLTVEEVKSVIEKFVYIYLSKLNKSEIE